MVEEGFDHDRCGCFRRTGWQQKHVERNPRHFEAGLVEHRETQKREHHTNDIL